MKLQVVLMGVFIPQKPANAMNQGFLPPRELVVNHAPPARTLMEMCSQRDLHVNVPSSFIQDGRKVKTIQMANNQRVREGWVNCGTCIQ